MNKTLKPATFFGSGPVAAQSLQLLSNWLSIDLVVTKKVPAHHKEAAPVESLAKKLGINIAYANNKKELDDLLYSNQLINTVYGIVIDYGVIISQEVIDYYPLGIINSHFSLLPEWRGADPITYSLLSGQQTTGVSLMVIDKGMDTGDLIDYAELKISETDNNESITAKLIILSNDLLKKSLPGYLRGDIKLFSQPNGIATYSTMIHKTDGVIDCNKKASVVLREIKAYNPWPGSRLQINGLWATITSACATDLELPLGKLNIIDKRLYLGCKQSAIEILELKPAGKKNMSAAAFINGYAHIVN